MNINDFDFNLPEELIAQTPLENEIVQNFWSLTTRHMKWLMLTLTIF